MGDLEQRALQLLTQHSALILDGIRNTLVSGLHLERGYLVYTLLSNFESNQIIIISGPAGNGKSAIAKNAITQLADELLCSAFAQRNLPFPIWTKHCSVAVTGFVNGVIDECAWTEGLEQKVDTVSKSVPTFGQYAEVVGQKPFLETPCFQPSEGYR